MRQHRGNNAGPFPGRLTIFCLKSKKDSVLHEHPVRLPRPVTWSRMRVAPPQNLALQLRHWRVGEVAWSEITLTERQSGPSRLGADFGAPRTRGAAPAPPAGLGVCWSPRRPCIVGVTVTTFRGDRNFARVPS